MLEKIQRQYLKRGQGYSVPFLLLKNEFKKV